MKPTNADWGWFAGLIDGDGCVSIGKQSGRYYRVSMIVVNKKPENILKLLRLFGGHLGKVSRTTASSFINGQYYRWVIDGKEVAHALKKSIPHLAEKAQKAKLALELCRIQSEYRSLHTYKNREGVNAKMEMIYQASLIETGRIDADATAQIRSERPARDILGQALRKE